MSQTAIKEETVRQMRKRADEFSESEEGKEILTFFGSYQRGIKRMHDYEHIIEKLEIGFGSISAVNFDYERVDRSPDVHAGVENESCQLVAMQEKHDKLCDLLKQLKEQIIDIIDKFIIDDIDNMCIKNHFIDGMTYDAIGVIIGYNKTTVHTHIFDALRSVVLPEDLITLNF